MLCKGNFKVFNNLYFRDTIFLKFDKNIKIIIKGTVATNKADIYVSITKFNC